MTSTLVGETGNFSAKYGVGTIAPKVFKEGFPSNIWYGARESITKYWTLILLAFGSIPNVVLNLTTPKTLTRSRRIPLGLRGMH